MAEGVYRNGSRILRDPMGQLVEVDPNAAEHLLTVGTGGKPFQEVTEQDVTKQDIEATQSTLGAQAETFARGGAEAVGDIAQIGSRLTQYLPVNRAAMELGKAVTGVDVLAPGRGLPAQVAGVAGGDVAAERAYEERTRQLREANPTAFGAGELTGNVLAGLATGGVTAGAAKGLTGLAARAGLGEMGATALGTGAAMAVEGGLYGAAQTEGQARMSGQTEGATAEQLLQGIGLGSLLGGTLGAGMGAGSTAFRRLMSRLDEAPPPATGAAGEYQGPVQRFRTEHADPWDLGGAPREVPIEPRGPAPSGSVAEAFERALPEDKLARLQSQLTGQKYETLARYGAQNTSAEAAEGRALWRQRDDLIDQTVPKMVNAVDRVDEALNTVTDQVRRVQLKKEGVEKMLEGINHEKALSYGNGQIAYVLQRAETVRNLIPGSAWSKGMRERLDRFIEYGQKHFTAAGKRPSAADTFIAADLIKREAQHVEKNLASIVTRSTDGNAVEAARKALEMFEQDIQEPLRLSLENKAIWGRAGQAQKEINAAWKADIDVSTRYGKELMTTDGAKVWADGRTRWYADSSKVKSWIDSIGTSAGMTRQQMVRQRIATAKELLAKIEKYHSVTDDQRPIFERAMKATDELEGELGKIDKTVAIANEIEDAAKVERSNALLNPLQGRVLGALTGAVSAGPMGALMGATGLLARPVAAMSSAEQIAALAARLGVRLEKRATAWVKTAGEGGGAAKPAGAMRQRAVKAGEAATGETARKVALASSMTLFMGRDKSLEDAYARRSEQLIRAQQDPDGMLDRIAAVTGGLGDVAPSVAGELVSKTQNAIGFLTSKSPAGTLDPTELMPGRKSIVPRLEMARFARVWAAVERPMTVLEDLERGTATPDQVEALRVVHPETYQSIRAAVSGALLDVSRRGGRIPIAMRQQLDLLLDLGGAGEPAFAPQVADRIAALQARRDTKPDKPQRASKPPNLAASLKLPQQRWPSAQG